MPQYFRAVAIDYDGTLTDGPEPRRDVLEALWEFRGTGRRAVLVTGRIMAELRQEFPEVDRAAWFTLEEARAMLNPAQLPLLDELTRKLASSGRP